MSEANKNKEVARAEPKRELTVQEKHLFDVHKKLSDFLDKKKDALPQDFNETRFLQNSITVLQDTKDIANIDPISIARTMLKGAFLGLDFLNKECYAIPYGVKEGTGWGKALQFQTDYKGEKKLAKKYSINPIKDIYAKLVKEGDLFEECIREGVPTINFNPKSFNDGKIIGAFAAALFKDGSMIYETMSKKEIENIRDKFSKASTGKAWVDTPGEMYKKTVIRRLCKHIELDFGSIERKQEWDEASGMEFDKKPQPQVAKSSLDNIIDVESKEIKDVDPKEHSNATDSN